MKSIAYHWEQKGVEKGVAKGIEEGIRREKITLVKKMLAKNKPLEEISDFTGFKKEEIEKFKKL